LNEKFDIKASNTGDGLITRGRLSNCDNEGEVRWRLKSKIRDGKVVNIYKCYQYKKEGYTRKYFPRMQKRVGNPNRSSRFGRRSNGSFGRHRLDLAKQFWLKKIMNHQRPS